MFHNALVCPAALFAFALLPAAALAVPAHKPAHPHPARATRRAPKHSAVKPPLLPPAQVRAHDIMQLRMRGAVAVGKAGPSREARMAVEVARVEVAAAEKELEHARDVTEKGLVARGELLRAQSDLAHARANLARAEAHVSGDKAGELKAAQA